MSPVVNPERCVWCLLPFGLIRMDRTMVEQDSPSCCTRCAEDIEAEQQERLETGKKIIREEF